MTTRGVCRLVQHYDMLILLAYRRYSMSRQKNTILINDHALNREPVPLRVRSVTQTSILVALGAYAYSGMENCSVVQVVFLCYESPCEKQLH